MATRTVDEPLPVEAIGMEEAPPSTEEKLDALFGPGGAFGELDEDGDMPLPI